MQYSGILVRFQPDAWDEGLRRLGALTILEIHHREPQTGRVIVVVESEGLAGQEAALLAIRDLPGVILAEPVYHYAPEDASDDAAEAGTPDAEHDLEEDPS